MIKSYIAKVQPIKVVEFDGTNKDEILELVSPLKPSNETKDEFWLPTSLFGESRKVYKGSLVVMNQTSTIPMVIFPQDKARFLSNLKPYNETTRQD